VLGMKNLKTEPFVVSSLSFQLSHWIGKEKKHLGGWGAVLQLRNIQGKRPSLFQEYLAMLDDLPKIRVCKKSPFEKRPKQ
jgi:hypothetical protein